MTYQVVIGLEIHAQLLTESKIFCGCSTRYGAEPNTQVCPVCLGLPGALPVLNQKAVEFAIAMGLATHCRIASISTFARKNYFYPDLPKGYQITQYQEPLCRDGYLNVTLPDGTERRIGIQRIHLEEDAGKSIHDPAVAGEATLIDFNRSGVPLIEIVTQPDLRSPTEARLFLEKLKKILVYLRICDGNMEEGSLRCDANVSLRPTEENEPGVKTELKNLNSFRNVERALKFEIERQTAILNGGGVVEPATLLWDATKNQARIIRKKEADFDYRYFPEPDLLPLEVSRRTVERIAETLPELPDARMERFRKQYQLSEYDATILTAERELADLYEQVVKYHSHFSLASNLFLREVKRILHQRKWSVNEFPVSPKNLAELLNLIARGILSQSRAGEVLEEMVETGKSAREVVEAKGLQQIHDREILRKVVHEVLHQFPEQVEQFRNGREKVFTFLMGQVMRKTGGKANPALLKELLSRALKNNYREK